jgi:hypothetical protein
LTTNIQRTTPFEFEAHQFDANNANATQTYVTSQTIGTNEYSTDENANPIVAVGLHPVNGTVYDTVYDGDYITKIFSEWWTIIRAADLATDWTIV